MWQRLQVGYRGEAGLLRVVPRCGWGLGLRHDFIGLLGTSQVNSLERLGDSASVMVRARQWALQAIS